MNPLAKKTVILKIVFLSLTVVSSLIIFGVSRTQAQYGSCSEYGIMAYESGGYCECMSGYVMGKDFMGNSQCISGDSICSDKYGYGSDYDSLSGSCGCRYGYVFGKDSIGRTQCITDDQACENQLGYHSSASFGGQCKCDSGYIIDSGQCKDGDQVCRSDHGLNASYSSLSNKCECDDGYTFDDENQCVEKHNSAYFTLLDINDETGELIVQNQHDLRNYIIEYGVGCFDYAVESYEGLSLVINMGTDFSVDMFDTLVLPNDDQNCPIMSVEWTSDDSFPEPEEEMENNWYIPPNTQYTPPANRINDPIIKTIPPKGVEGITEIRQEDILKTSSSSLETGPADERSSTTQDQIQEETNTEEPIQKHSIFSRILNFFKNLF